MPSIARLSRAGRARATRRAKACGAARQLLDGAPRSSRRRRRAQPSPYDRRMHRATLLRHLRDRARRLRARLERGRPDRRVAARRAAERAAPQGRAALGADREAVPRAAIAAIVEAIAALARRRARRPARRRRSTTPHRRLRSPRLRRHARHRAGPRAHLRRRRRAGRRRRSARAVGQSLGAQPLSDRRALPSRRRHERRARRLLRAGRRDARSGACWRSKTRASTGRPISSTQRRRASTLAEPTRSAALRSRDRSASPTMRRLAGRRLDRGVGPLVGADQAAARQAVLADRLEHRLAPGRAVEDRAARQREHLERVAMHAVARRRVGRQPARLQVRVAADPTGRRLRGRARPAPPSASAPSPPTSSTTIAWTSGCGVGASASSTMRTSEPRVGRHAGPAARAATRPAPSAVYAAGIGAWSAKARLVTVIEAMPARRSTAWKAILSRPARWPRSAWPSGIGQFFEHRISPVRSCVTRHFACPRRSARLRSPIFIIFLS